MNSARLSSRALGALLWAAVAYLLPFGCGSPGTGTPGEGTTSTEETLSVASGSWTELGPKPIHAFGQVNSGRVTALAVDLAKDPSGNTVYAGAAFGGIWMSTNALSASPAFLPISDNSPILTTGSLALDSSTSPTTVYVGTGEPLGTGDTYYGRGIMKSVDGGQTWTIATSADGGTKPFLGLGFFRVVVDPTNPQVLLAAASDLVVRRGGLPVFPGVYRSADGGASWNQVLPAADAGSSGANATEVAYDPTRSTYYAAIVGAGFYRSTDRGVTWSSLPSPFTNGAPVTANNFFRAALAVRDNTLYAAVAGNPTTPCTGGTTPCDSGVYESTDGGSTWAALSPPPTPFDSYRMFIAAPPGSASLVVGSYLPSVTSQPNGMNTTWTTDSSVHVDQHAIATIDGARWYIGNDGGVYRSTNGGLSHTDMNATLGITQFYDVSVAPSQPGPVLGGAQDNGAMSASSALGAGIWNELFAGDSFCNVINPKTPSQYFIESNGGSAAVLRSDNGGSLWNTVVDSSTTGDSQGAAPLALMPNDPTVLVRAGAYVSRGPATPSSPGAGWVHISQNLGIITALQIAPSNPQVMYATTSNGSVFQTTAAGVNPTWTDVKPPTQTVLAFGAAAIHPTNSNVLYVGVAQFGASKVFVTTTGASSWTDITGNLPDTPVRTLAIDPVRPTDIYAGTDQGVYVITDGGSAGTAEVWQSMGSALPRTQVVSLKFSSGANRVLVAGTHGRGAWSIPPLAGSGGAAAAPVADAYVRDGSSASKNFGTATDLEVKTNSSGLNRYTYLKFSMSGIATVSSATLRLFGGHATSGTATDNAYGVSNTSWSEKTINWKNKPALGTKQSSATISTTQQYYSWDVTEWLQAQKSAGASLVTLAVKMNASNANLDTFNSRESSGNPPQLVVVP